MPCPNPASQFQKLIEANSHPPGGKEIILKEVFKIILWVSFYFLG
jgi:hypothetical protein